MTRRPLRLVAALALVGALIPVVRAVDRHAGRSSAVTLAADRVLGPSDPSTRVRFQAVLRLRDRSLHRFLAAVNDPDSPRFGRFISGTQFGRRFGLPVAKIDSIREELERQGFDVEPADIGRTALEVAGTTSLLDRYLGVTFLDHLDPWGRLYHAPAERVVVPPSISGSVRALAGLSDRQFPPSVRHQTEQGVSASTLGPKEIAKAFDITPLWKQGVRGEGEVVAVYSADSFFKEDVAAFDTAMGIEGAPDVVPVFPDGEFEAGNEALLEVNLDIDTIRSVAPGAQILNYAFRNAGTTSYGRAARDVAEKGIKILSISYGPCDDTNVRASDGTPFFLPEDRAFDEQEFAFAESLGVNIFVSTGDTGAYSCQRFDPDNVALATSYPGDSAHVTTVGGTRLTLDADGSYLREAGWEEVISQFGGGGGLNPLDPRPAWQVGPGVDNADTNGKRQVPDVSGPADSYVGFYMVSEGSPQKGNGTSQSTPFWAGVTALVQQYASQHGVEELGFLPRVLYQLAAHEQPFPPFHDVTVGGNRAYNCTPGWDFVTGLGSPDAYNLARDVTQYLHEHPARNA